MPKYEYECRDCHLQWSVWHGMNDNSEPCACGSKETFKIPPSFISNIKKVEKNEKKVGEVTESSIEENREVLKKFKEDSKGDYKDG